MYSFIVCVIRLEQRERERGEGEGGGKKIGYKYMLRFLRVSLNYFGMRSTRVFWSCFTQHLNFIHFLLNERLTEFDMSSCS